MRAHNNTVWAGMAAFVVLALLFAGLLLSGHPLDVAAAPAAAPTPVSASAGSPAPTMLTFADGETVTAAGPVGSALILGAAQRVDLQHVVNIGDANNITLTLQFSNDGENWIDGVTFATGVSADQTDMQQYNVFGRYARVYADVATTNTVTTTVIGVGR